MAVPAIPARPAGPPRAMFVRVAWRNLWRRRLRTWMSAAGIGFAIFLVSTFTSLQHGSYDAWIETATGLMTGHLQLQDPRYFDDPKVEHAMAGGSELVGELERASGVAAATARTEAFALVSAGERSFGALVMGVDAERERRMFALPHQVVEGAYLPRSDSAFVATALAANLGVGIGDEIITLGSMPSGGIAVLVLTVDGVFRTGQSELDRSILQVPIAAMQRAYELGDAVHRVVVETADAGRAMAVKARLADTVPAGTRLLDWNELIPELAKGIELDRISALMIYWLLMIVVVMSVANAFTMTVFERTREFGMLLAIGMRPNAVVGMVVVEAVCVWALGAALGLALATATVVPLSYTGIDVAGIEGMREMAEEAMMPTHLRPAFGADAVVQPPLIMLAGTLVAALIPALRMRRLRVVDALRAEE